MDVMSTGYRQRGRLLVGAFDIVSQRSINRAMQRRIIVMR
jgi:hypothetical protein